jgi:hypothetical protein
MTARFMNDFGGRQLGNGRYNGEKRASAARISPLQMVIELTRVALGHRRARSSHNYVFTQESEVINNVMAYQ